ncbi:MAG: phosphoribosylformylglycinamidine cyclo-ligase [Clostridia bacterium]|nr:phosphoribosylformylglycinamidine cyclo-ligase [Clostridia bacterium]
MSKELINPYSALGVSSDKEGVHKATARLSKGEYPDAFCQIVSMPRNLPAEIRNNFVMVIHSDGVGTKSNVAYIAMNEGLGMDYLRNLAQDAIVMNTDDMACVGVLDDIRISNHIARCSKRVNDTALDMIVQGYSDYFEKMKELGINLDNAGGETADVGSYTTTMGIDVTAVAVIARDNVIDCSNIGPDEYIVGLASYGKCSYEDKENSGIRSNGLTLAINTLLDPYYRKYTETMDHTVPVSNLFCGKYRLEDKLEGSSLTVVDAILSPTRTYIPVLRDVLHDDIQVSGIIHCSGGGLTKSVNFGKNITYVKDKLCGLEVPPIFREIQKIGNFDDYHMYQTFNMGIGLEVIVKSLSDAEKVISYANNYDIDAFVIGHTKESEDGKNHVKIGSSVYTK